MTEQGFKYENGINKTDHHIPSTTPRIITVNVTETREDAFSFFGRYQDPV